MVGGNRQWKIMKWADAKNEFEAIKIRLAHLTVQLVVRQDRDMEAVYTLLHN